MSVPTRSRRWPNLVRALVVLIVFGFILSVLVRDLGEVRGRLHDARPWLLFAALATYVVFLVGQALLWHMVTFTNQASIPASRAVIAWLYSGLGKYVPGKVMLWAARIVPYRRHAQSVQKVTFCFSLEIALQFLGSGIIVATAIALSPKGPLAAYRHAAWLLVAMLAIVVNPRVIEVCANYALGLLKRPPIVVSMRLGQSLALTIGYVANGLLVGLGFFLLVSALHPTIFADYFFLVGSLLLAGMIGLVSLLAPAGLGVRDGILLVALETIMPSGAAALVVIVARLWTTMGDLAGAGLAFAWDRMTVDRPSDSA